MNPIVDIIAKEVATQLSNVVNVPFLSKEEEETFFLLVVTKVLEVIIGHLLSFLEKKHTNAETQN